MLTQAHKDSTKAMLDSLFGGTVPSYYDYATAEIIGQFPLFTVDGTVTPIQHEGFSSGRNDNNVPLTYQPILLAVKRYTLCTAALQSYRGSKTGKQLWDIIDEIAGVDKNVIATRNSYRVSGLHGWWNTKRDGIFTNQVHPYDHLVGTGGKKKENTSYTVEYFTINESITFFQSFQKHVMENFPHYPGEGKKIAIPSMEWSSTGKPVFLTELIESKLLTIPDGTKIISLLTYLKARNRTQNDQQEQNFDIRSNEMREIMYRKAGLVLDVASYAEEVNALRRDFDEDRGVMLVGLQKMAHLLPFFSFIGISAAELENAYKGKISYYPSIADNKTLFRRYQQNKNVQLMAMGLDILAKAEVDLTHSLLKHAETFNNVVMMPPKGYRGLVSHGKTIEALESGDVRCPGGDACDCAKSNFYNPLMTDWDHFGEKAKEQKKKTTRSNKKVKQPSEYDEEDWKIQGPWMMLVCCFYHNIKTCEERGGCDVLRINTQRRLRNALVLEQSGKGCVVSHDLTKINANDKNMMAFVNHHLAMRYNLLFGNVLLITKKYSELSRIAQDATSFNDFVENLYPEIILTRVMDVRIHRLFHRLLKERVLHKQLGVEFPFKLVMVRGEKTWKYTKASVFDDMEKQTVELPSAIEVLGVSDFT